MNASSDHHRDVPLRKGTVLSIDNIPTTRNGRPAGPQPYYQWRKGATDPQEELRRVHAIAATMGVALVEVVSGRRGIGQITRWVHPDLMPRIQMRRDLETRPHSEPTPSQRREATFTESALRPQRVRAVRVAPEEYEASVVVHNGSRARAVALRIHKPRGQWTVTAVEIG